MLLDKEIHFLILFIPTMEGLPISMKGDCDQHILQGISLPNHGHKLFHLMYAHDVTFIE